MSLVTIPEQIDFVRYAAQQIHVKGVLPIALMDRVHSYVQDKQGEAKLSLEFGTDSQGLSYLKGRIDVSLKLQCQRCMEALPYEIMADFVLAAVKSLDEVDSLPTQYEAVLLGERGLVALRELIEDEVILNIPQVPKHNLKDCKVILSELQIEAELTKKKHPFMVLESLKPQQK